jgi:hypothetical protein
VRIGLVHVAGPHGERLGLPAIRSVSAMGGFITATRCEREGRIESGELTGRTALDHFMKMAPLNPAARQPRIDGAMPNGSTPPACGPRPSLRSSQRRNSAMGVGQLACSL